MGCHSSAGWGVIWTHMHECIFTYRAPLSQPEQGSGPRVCGGGGGGGLGADTFLLTITSHTGTHIPTSWWPPHPSCFPELPHSHPPPPAGLSGSVQMWGKLRWSSIPALEKHRIINENVYGNKKVCVIWDVCHTFSTLHILEYHEIKTLELIKFSDLVYVATPHIMSSAAL